MSLIDDLLVTIDDKAGITRDELLAISEKPSQKASLYSALARLVSKGLVKEKSEGFVITETGKYRLDYFLQAISELKNDNKKWWIVLVELPESQRLMREKLRYEFRKIGVGTVKKGVYIVFSHNQSMIENIIENLGIKKQTHIIQIEQLQPQSTRAIADTAWDWEAINDDYKSFIENKKNLLDNLNNFSNDVRRIEAKKTVFRFAKILLKDPKLPDSMHKQDSPRIEAYRLYQKIRPYCYD